MNTKKITAGKLTPFKNQKGKKFFDTLNNSIIIVESLSNTGAKLNSFYPDGNSHGAYVCVGDYSSMPITNFTDRVNSGRYLLLDDDQEFEFKVNIARITSAYSDFTVRAKSIDEAKQKAMDEASNLEWGTGNAEYEIQSLGIKNNL